MDASSRSFAHRKPGIWSAAIERGGQPEEVPTEACRLVILDVRTAQEFSLNHLEGSINLDFKSPSFSELISGLDKKKAYQGLLPNRHSGQPGGAI